MLEKIKDLSTTKKIIIGLVALISLPITLLVVGIDLSITGFRKKDTGKAIFGILLTIVMVNMFANSTVAEPEATVEEVIQSNESNNSIFGDGTLKPVTNGSKTEIIGERLEITYNNTEFTESNFLEFYNSAVKDKSYNYVNIKIDDKTGIIFPGCLNYFYYGIADEEGVILEELGSGEIKDNKVLYKEAIK